MPVANEASAAAALRRYFHAKDENRPHLLQAVFREDATLRMTLRTGNISFPDVAEGRAAIADALVRRFGQAYENVYSFYLDRPVAEASRFSCDWLVMMSDKASGEARVGCGRYDWEFDEGVPVLAKALAITIHTMLILPAGQLDVILAWARALPYPWCDATTALRHAPDLPELAPVRTYLQR